MADRSGPLHGIKIIELAGIGPAPFTCMMLADAGAQVLRLERAAPGAVERGEEFARVGSGPALGPAEPVPALGGHRPEEPRRGRARARPGRAGRRADRGLPARGGRAAGRRARGLLGPQPQPRLRPHDRLGPGRPDGRRWPGTTSTTSPSVAPCGRSAGADSAPVPPAEPGRRLRRRRHAARLRHGGRAPRGGPLGRGAGGRRGHGRRLGLAHDDDPRLPPLRDLERASAAPTCSTPAPPSTRSTRRRTGSGWRWARIESQFYAALLEGPGAGRGHVVARTRWRATSGRP